MNKNKKWEISDELKKATIDFLARQPFHVIEALINAWRNEAHCSLTSEVKEGNKDIISNE